MGPSFFTKFLYFAGYDCGAHRHRPLILDRTVRSALEMLSGLVLDPSSADDYGLYLEVAHSWAEEWHTEPDVVERALFAVGQCGPLAVNLLLGRRL
ncbi:8-oxoguanine DNA glycosylase OGG fold protein [Asanoa iriomotensis]|uniref:8-oxoguanine DNA glycosylase OGG fold protein n=1 Tax=Asanoa iriomotensis TaxID=234613 RepID=UPI001941FE55|nr:hypothetical protein [Asanoa iriomotensis]